MKIIGIAASFSIWSLLKDKTTYQVHSCFDSGFNVKIGSILCFIGNKRNTKLPYGILIPEEMISTLIKKVRSGNICLTWDNERKQFLAKDFIIDMSQAYSFESKILPLGKIDHKKARTMLRNSIDMNRVTGFGKSFEDILTKDNEMLLSLYESFQWENKEEIQLIIKKWMGRGMGLTPSGDDFLLGILFVHQMNPILSNSFYQCLWEMIQEGLYTTDTSTHYYICAYEGLYSEPLLELSNAIMIGDARLLKKRVEEILNFGHTSGSDILAGIMAGMF